MKFGLYLKEFKSTLGEEYLREDEAPAGDAGGGGGASADDFAMPSGDAGGGGMGGMGGDMMGGDMGGGDQPDPEEQEKEQKVEAEREKAEIAAEDSQLVNPKTDISEEDKEEPQLPLDFDPSKFAIQQLRDSINNLKKAGKKKGEDMRPEDLMKLKQTKQTIEELPPKEKEKVEEKIKSEPEIGKLYSKFNLNAIQDKVDEKAEEKVEDEKTKTEKEAEDEKENEEENTEDINNNEEAGGEQPTKEEEPKPEEKK